ncbi:MAG: hypothetical protein JW713_05080, partial [Pontiellaceae bacterium]|nr:hypothetical protein [Pontiellaceae bacterium]
MKRMKPTRISRLAAVVLFLHGFAAVAGAELVISNSVYTTDLLLNTNVTLIGKSELHITSGASPIAGSIINMTDEDSWVFMHETAPSGVNISRYQVAGAAAVKGTNVKVVQYGEGAVIIPYPSDFKPMEIFTQNNFCGDCQQLGPNTSYETLLNGKISSFTLKRGYMATLAQNSDGTGISINYVASDGDVRIAALPDTLNNQVNFIRIYPWHWVTKKGSCDIWPSEVNANWYYNWNISGAAANPDFEYVGIRQQRWWPGIPTPSDAAYMGMNHLSGYNEPDNPVEDAYESLDGTGAVGAAIWSWPDLLWNGMRVGSPAVTDGGYSWITDFMDQADDAGLRVDYIPIHYYRASNNNAATAAANLKTYLQAVYDLYHKPIWVTEFNNGANWTTATDPTFQQNSDCIEAMINMMDDTPWIERYAVYSAVEEVRQVYYNAGGYTPMGQMYKDHIAPLAYQQILPGKGMAAQAFYRFENRLADVSGAGNDAVSHNYPDFVPGHDDGTAIQFNGTDDHVILPDSLSDGTDFTFAAWVYWTGGSAWQRIFDFGIMDSSEYMFLTPTTGSNLRFTITTSGWGGEQRLNATSPLPQNAWTHVAVTLSGNTGRMYVNGSQVAVNTSMALNPSDLGAIQHYLGRSMFPA